MINENIHLVATGKCFGCKIMDLKVSRLYSNDMPAPFVSCVYKEACDRLEDYLREKIRRETENERAEV